MSNVRYYYGRPLGVKTTCCKSPMQKFSASQEVKYDCNDDINFSLQNGNSSHII